MRTILKIGYQNFLLPKDANTAAVLKALGGATELRACYSSDREKKEFRQKHQQDTKVELQLVNDKAIGPALDDEDDFGEQVATIEPEAKPARKQLPAPMLRLGNGGQS